MVMTDHTATEKPSQTLHVPHQDMSADIAFDHDHMARDFERVVGNLVRELRAVANRVEQITAPPANQEHPGFSERANDVVTAIGNMMPNLGLSNVLRAAAQADTALLEMRLRRSVDENEALRSDTATTAVPLDADDEARA